MKRDENRYFPMFVNLEKKRILVAGAGNVALRRIRTLLRFGADITVVARDVPAQMREPIETLLSAGEIRLCLQEFSEELLTDEVDIVLAATDDSALNERIGSLCRRKRIPVNNASDRRLCDFWFPAVVFGEDVTIGIAGDGTNHRSTAEAASQIREWMENKYEKD